MGSSIVCIADPVVEKVAGPPSANVDAIVFGQSEKEDVSAVVIEWNSFEPSGCGQFLIAERPRHSHIFVYRQDRVSEKSQPRGERVGRQDQRLCSYRVSSGRTNQMFTTFFDVGDGCIFVNL